MELYAIARAGSGEILWAGLATAQHAEATAVMFAVGAGAVNLLSGEDLALHLLGGEPRRLAPTHALESTWEVGGRVELMLSRHHPEQSRLGTVERIDRTYGYHESLVVRFDDGEVRPINPDVMRRVRP